MRVNKKCHILHHTTNLHKIMLAALLIIGTTLVYQVTSENPRENENSSKNYHIKTAVGIIFVIPSLLAVLFGICCIKSRKEKAKRECKNERRERERREREKGKEQEASTPICTLTRQAQGFEMATSAFPEELQVNNEYLQRKNEYLQRKNEYLQRKNGELLQKNGELQQENDKVKKHLANYEQEKYELQQENEYIRGKYDELQQENEYLRGKSDTFQQENENLKRKLEKYEQEKHELQQENENLKRKLAYLHRNYEYLQGKTKYEQEKHYLHRNYEYRQRKYEYLHRNYEYPPWKNDEFQQENENLKRKLEEFKKTLAESEQEKNELQQENEEFKKTLARNEQEKYELQQEIDELQQEIDRRKTQYKSVWKNAPLYPDWRKEEFKAVTVTLDAATAHPALHLSDHGRRVTWQERGQDLPSSTQRFQSLPCVLGQLFISSGRCYWEVEVGKAHFWDLGVCRDNVTRKGRITMSPQNGFWAIRLYSGEYWAVTSPETLLTVREKPLKVGIFVDYEDGDVSFFNMTDGSHIFSFPKNTFHGVLRPLFRLWSSDSGSLSICPGEGKELTDVVIPMLH